MHVNYYKFATAEEEAADNLRVQANQKKLLSCGKRSFLAGVHFGAVTTILFMSIPANADYFSRITNLTLEELMANVSSTSGQSVTQNVTQNVTQAAVGAASSDSTKFRKVLEIAGKVLPLTALTCTSRIIFNFILGYGIPFSLGYLFSYLCSPYLFKRNFR